MKKQTTVKFYHVGDTDYNGTVLYVAESRKSATQYVQDWLNAHSTKLYPFTYKGDGRWESKFSAIYLA